MKYQSIVLALSCSESSSPVIEVAFDCVKQYNADLKVLHVNDPAAGKMSMMMDGAGHKYTEPEIMDMLMARNSDLNTDAVHIQILTSEDIPEAVSMAVVEGDLLVVGHRRMTIIKEKLSDSLDQQIINKVNCHSLVIPI
jgi:nucleotide-binding universal stress UspA family protein|tara:strand:+ start:332 stop:748 length:417 start_codon:yes stop_codon:yes gene_type:complete